MSVARGLPAALRPTTAQWAVRPAIWALLAAAVVAGAGVVTGDQMATGLAYFGVACAAVLVTAGAYRARVISLVCSSGGAVAGIMIGVAVADSVPLKVTVAALVAMVSGMIGALGRLFTAAALMAVIGLAFGEFGGVRLPGWEQGAWYGVGALALAICALVGWPAYRDRSAWSAVAAVFDRSADLLQHAVGSDSSARRLALAEASAISRAEVFEHRFGQRGLRADLLEASGRADQAALVAAAFITSGHAAREHEAPDEEIAAFRQAAVLARARQVPALPASVPLPLLTRSVRPLGDRFRVGLRVVTSARALQAGLRVAVCMTIATAIACALHTESHSFWLPLTVAVAVRPEYASVFVRTLNRTAGTAVGALLAAAVIATLGSGWPIAIAAAISLGFAALAVPKLYALSVVGVTCSALLSSCIGAADPINPAIRLLDTLIGCVIAIVFGYLIWPRRNAVPVDLTEVTTAVADYLQQAIAAPPQRCDWTAVRDRAYQLAHESRRSAQAALLDPMPVRAQAAHVLPQAVALEALVDEVTAIANRVDAGVVPSETEVARVGDRIAAAGA